jgi:hypothetical protein
VLTFCVAPAFAQLRQFPLDQSPTHGRINQHHGRSKVTIDTLQLPFWDDFSVTTGNYPDTLKWAQGYRVFVGNTLGWNQPTFNVATFDGLDSLGRAYEAQQVLETGFSDMLTSQPIDLSVAGVSVEERPTVFLSFFYQWKGKGEAPDNSDFLQLEFRKKSDSTWTQIAVIATKASFVDSVFYDTIIQVPQEEEYFYEGFQFRFRNFGRKSGPFDTWNLDYIYLDKGRNPDDLIFRDRSVASPLSSPFGEYVSKPYKHFLLDPVVTPITFEISNLDSSPTTAQYDVTGYFSNYVGDDTIETSKSLLKNFPIGDINGDPGRVEAQSRLLNVYGQLGNHTSDPMLFNPDAKGLDMELKVELLSGDTFPPISNLNYEINDTISHTWYLRDYYAYDDGTAEYSAGLIEPGNEIAYQFNITSYPDTLKAIDFYFPAYGVSSNQGITFKVYNDEGGVPGDNNDDDGVDGVLGSYGPRTIQQKLPNQFERLLLIPALLITEPTFYIGWIQPTAGRALIGLDMDTDTGDRIFVNEGSGWYKNEVIHGSMMLRPVFGKGLLEDEVNTGVEDDLQFSIYPNPNGGNFFIDGDFDHLQIYNTTGGVVPFHGERIERKTHVQVDAPRGLYLVRVIKGAKAETHKVIISR